MTLKFTQEENPDIVTIKAIEDGLMAYNSAMAGPHNPQPLWLVGRDDAGNVLAGLKGGSFFKWLYVEWLWIAEEFRRRSYGSKLLSQAEQVAKERGCIGVFLVTFSFQAPDFYVRHGYKEFARMSSFPPGHDRIYLCKTF